MEPGSCNLPDAAAGSIVKTAPRPQPRPRTGCYTDITRNMIPNCHKNPGRFRRPLQYGILRIGRVVVDGHWRADRVARRELLGFFPRAAGHAAERNAAVLNLHAHHLVAVGYARGVRWRAVVVDTLHGGFHAGARDHPRNRRPALARRGFLFTFHSGKNQPTADAGKEQHKTTGHNDSPDRKTAVHGCLPVSMRTETRIAVCNKPSLLWLV